jgi:hypothetical protein
VNGEGAEEEKEKQEKEEEEKDSEEGSEEDGTEDDEGGEEDIWDAALREDRMPLGTLAFVEEGAEPSVLVRRAIPFFAVISNYRTGCSYGVVPVEGRQQERAEPAHAIPKSTSWLADTTQRGRGFFFHSRRGPRYRKTATGPGRLGEGAGAGKEGKHGAAEKAKTYRKRE